MIAVWCKRPKIGQAGEERNVRLKYFHIVFSIQAGSV